MRRDLMCPFRSFCFCVSCGRWPRSQIDIHELRFAMSSPWSWRLELSWYRTYDVGYDDKIKVSMKQYIDYLAEIDDPRVTSLLLTNTLKIRCSSYVWSVCLINFLILKLDQPAYLDHPAILLFIADSRVLYPKLLPRTYSTYHLS